MRLAQRIRRSWHWYALLAVPLALFLLFVAWPTVNAFRLSLFKEVGGQEVFVGLDHYVRLLNDRNGTVKASKVFRATSPVSGEGNDAYVRGLDAAFGAVGAEIVEWVDGQV